MNALYSGSLTILTSPFLKSYVAVKTLSRLASIRAVTGPSILYDAASTKSEDTEYSGIFKPFASILATVAAILIPV